MIFVLGRGRWVHDAQAFRKGLARSRIYTTILTISKRAPINFVPLQPYPSIRQMGGNQRIELWLRVPQTLVLPLH